MLPIDILSELGKWGGYTVFFLIGAGFGFALEIAGFGDSRRLAAQFYLKDMTVLKTMFSAIIVACLLLFFSAAIGILDFAQINVNQTYLWPGIVGGLIMGVGFIIGGYCPGTSLVAAASFKVDGIFFVIGATIGAGLFGESLPAFEDFWNSSYTERLLVSDWLGWSIGATVVAVTILALAMFYGAEKTEEFFRNQGKNIQWTWKITNKWYKIGAGALLSVALLIWIIGQPTPDRKWELMKDKYESLLTSGAVFITPYEYVKTYNDASVKLVTLDLRSQDVFEQFHLQGSKSVNMDNMLEPEFVTPLAQLPAQGVVLLIADKEEVAVKAWQYLKVQGVANVYILENGLADWNKLFAGKTIHGKSFDLASPPVEVLKLFPENCYIPKIKIASKKRSGGLCS